MLLENFTKFMNYYGKGRKLKLFGFFTLSLVVGLFEFIGLALIYPFILLLISPEKVIHTTYYTSFVAFSHVNNVLSNTFILGCLVMLLFVGKNIFMIISMYLQNKFVSTWKFVISKTYMYYYLFSSYKDSIATTPAEKIYNLNSLIDQTLDGFIFRIINLCTNTIIVVMILTLLFVKFPIPAIITFVFTIFCIIFQSKILRAKIEEISKKVFKISSLNNEKTIKVVHNIKEIKILSAEKYFYDDYIRSKWDCTKINFESGFCGSIPPYIMEILVVLALFSLAGLISLQHAGNTSWIVASYAIIAAAIFRIAPALNRIQSAVNAINTSRGFVKIILLRHEESHFDSIEMRTDLNIEFKNNIVLKNVCFAYNTEPVIKDLNLEIRKGEFIGIIGASGAGKSTLADIIMGLFPVGSGEILVDDLELNKDNFSALRKLIGYVPQQINVLDDSFRNNVAFGVDEKDINDEKVIQALKSAQLYYFVEGFEEGINAKIIVGSTGMSQGQKQRLAIARALYRNSDILILDEATSSLDVETEYEITNMLNGLKGEKTIIAIAHRLSTLKSCDRLIYLKEGRVVDTGSFNELAGRHADFENLIKLSSLGV